MEKNNRIDWVDFLKGIAILWLVIYHFYAIGWMRSPVPIFFFLSGLFYTDGKSFGEFIGKKAKALLIPFVFFFLLGIAASWMKCFLLSEAFIFPPLWQFATLIPADDERTNPLGIGAIWFLVSLFEIYVIYYALRKVSNNKWWLFTSSVLLFLFSAIMMQHYGNGSWFYLFYTFGFFIFFVTAHLLKERILFKKIPIWVLIVSICAYSVRFLDMSSMVDASQIGGGILYKFRGMISMMGAIGILVWMAKRLFGNKYLATSRLFSFVLFEGRNSITILGVHLLIMGVVSILLKRFMPIGVLYYLALFVIIVAGCNLCIILFNRYVPFLVNHKRNSK